MRTVAVTGFDGGKLKQMADEGVHIPVDDMGMTEALHSVVFHLAMSQLRERVAAAGP
jgi:D-sedoheptulose 7-phosphate isomerase